MNSRKLMSRLLPLIALVALLASSTLSHAAPPPPVPAPTLGPKTIVKWVNQLPTPPVYQPTVITDGAGNVVRHEYTIKMSRFMEQILPAPLPMTEVWGYEGAIVGSTVPFQGSPGATFEATRGIPVQVKWINNITGTHKFAVDPTLHWANPNMMPMNPPQPWPPFPPGFPAAQSPVPLVTHLHGGEVQSIYDGHPDAWFTQTGLTGPAYATDTYTYLNSQPATTLWYHDHALGITRLNVMSGLAGFYLLRDPNDTIAPLLPSAPYEIPLAIQDRSFNLDGSLFFPSVGINPTIHPYWQPEFFGNTIMVNGKVWPNLNVQPRQYRFRLLNGSNARFYNLALSNKQPFTQIGAEGGYLPAPVVMSELLIAPGERADVLMDFSALPAGTTLTLMNNARTPYPKGAPPDPQTTGQIMQFTVVAAPVVTPTPLPATLITIPALTAGSTRTLTLVEVMGPAGPTEVLLDGQKWHMPISELPKVGTTEDWEIVNLTADTHPIHLHLVQFQVVSRQAFQTSKYLTDWTALNGMAPLMQPTVVLPTAGYLQGKPSPPAPNELGWKDTFKANTGEVTRIRVRFAPLDATTATPGQNLYPFDPTTGPGYVWHCHILDHEDNEMMRPYRVTP